MRRFRGHTTDSAVPAVVVGLGLNGLGVLRSLARGGVQVIAVDDSLGKPGMRSRYGRKLRVPALQGEVLVAELVALANTLPERPVLFVTQEATVRTVCRFRDRLEPHYRLTFGDPSVIDCLMDKRDFQLFAETHGFRVPRSLHIRDETTLGMAEALRFPVILKPSQRNAAYSRQFKKAYKVKTFEELVALCRDILPVCADMMVQEWIEGTDADIYFCLQYIDVAGTPVASFTGRKIRSWPPQTGGTASCTAASRAVSETLTLETTRFFGIAGLTGMVSMEYKKDDVTGEFYLIEPTVGRTDFQEEVATLNGVNIPLAAWRTESGHSSLPDSATASSPQPMVWRSATVDKMSAEQQKQRWGHGPLESGRKVNGWWRWYDPGPSATLFWRRVGPAVRKRLDRARFWHRARAVK